MQNDGLGRTVARGLAACDVTDVSTRYLMNSAFVKWHGRKQNGNRVVRGCSSDSDTQWWLHMITQYGKLSLSLSDRSNGKVTPFYQTPFWPPVCSTVCHWAGGGLVLWLLDHRFSETLFPFSVFCPVAWCSGCNVMAACGVFPQQPKGNFLRNTALSF